MRGNEKKYFIYVKCLKKEVCHSTPSIALFYKKLVTTQVVLQKQHK
ncbi:MAG: hypothetical protein JETT_3137 [Candidatus Jettenia ecosi]|uniref:Uncharacterized protein n=1 Tax=Candidatus Jettenia ecosi TaxID=2494326 RepID=A0A533QD73_9BACT|nr:MAG: hypothetical protein JETT_3137 [Candidatus Jettenia ecosi]